MSVFFKGLYERVVVHYGPTLIGIGIGIGILVADASVEALQALPQGWAKIAAAIIMAAGAYLKSKKPAPVDAPKA